MIQGERQVATSIEGIRADHVNRYKWVIDHLPKGTVIDAACGIGYGSWVLANEGFFVRGVEIDYGAIVYGEKYYPHRNLYRQHKDLHDAELCSDPVVAFECIEHIEDPLPILKKCGKILISSVPNESVFPYKNYKFHYRHYTKQEYEDLLNQAGYTVSQWYGQEGPESTVEKNIEGRTLIAVAHR